MRRLFALFLVLAAASVPAGAASAQVEIVDYGFYDLSVSGRVPAPGDVSLERNVVSNIRLNRQTREIDAQLGRSFGYRFRIRDSSLHGKTLVLRSIFPPLTNPETGRSARTQDREFVGSGAAEPLYDGYRFDYDWEMAEGEWIFQIVDGNRVISEMKFKVVVALH